MNRKVSVALLLMLLSTGIAQANQMLPEKCPSVSAIISEKLDHVIPLFDGWIGLKDRSQYDTKDTWTFVNLFPIVTKDQEEALRKSVASLSLLHFQDGPEEAKDGKGAVCSYVGSDSSVEFGAVAITPPMEDVVNLMTIRKKH